jgi:hypothetical protein|tara:strand:+ start:507 stop:653 length:147 start_codon:yes stop_codon:yes gene_type:complete
MSRNVKTLLRGGERLYTASIGHGKERGGKTGEVEKLTGRRQKRRLCVN